MLTLDEINIILRALRTHYGTCRRDEELAVLAVVNRLMDIKGERGTQDVT